MANSLADLYPMSSPQDVAVVSEDLVASSTTKPATQGFRIEDKVVLACNGLGLKNLLVAGQHWLETHVEFVNRLNVFPVPDGDTGTNMLLTMRAATEQLEQISDYNVGNIALAAARGALMGARGNSGVILSQLLQGLALGLEGQIDFTATDLVRAAQLGVEQAYQSVVEPVEGTMLTVAREAATAAAKSATSTSDLVALLSDIVEAAKIAQAKTPELLPVLSEAGVTDAGGQGLVYILEGGLRFLKSEPVDLDPVEQVAPQLQSALGIEEEAYGYDVQFLIQGDRLDVAEIRAYIDRLGWSTLVVGDEQVVKVHVHTQDPGIPLSYGAKQGIISDVVVENLEVQAKAFVHKYAAVASARTAFSTWPVLQEAPTAKGATADTAIIAVVSGHGLAQIFQSLGVSQVLAGGQTMNPSTQELLEAIRQVESENVLILPNNGHVLLAARQAQALASKNVEVVPTKTIPQGIAALLSFNYQIDLEANAQRMLEASRQVQTVEVTKAVRASTVDGFEIKPGDVLGVLDNELTSVGQDYQQVVIDVLAQLKPDLYEIVTIYFGQDSSPQQAQALADRISNLYPDLEVEVYVGGQPHYQYIISVE